jgi:hypothetical protein
MQQLPDTLVASDIFRSAAVVVAWGSARYDVAYDAMSGGQGSGGCFRCGEWASRSVLVICDDDGVVPQDDHVVVVDEVGRPDQDEPVRMLRVKSLDEMLAKATEAALRGYELVILDSEWRPSWKQSGQLLDLSRALHAWGTSLLVLLMDSRLGAWRKSAQRVVSVSCTTDELWPMRLVVEKDWFTDERWVAYEKADEDSFEWVRLRPA